ncbi:MAG TPA: hypothetical protein VJ752_04310 [Burkholderiaceae bacterium]|nr:hypothetical protein [Burkholderiaceae bacterium]
MSELLCARFVPEKTSFGGNARKKNALALACAEAGWRTVALAPQWPAMAVPAGVGRHETE